MDLYQNIKHMYPELEDGKDFVLKNDGNGSYILKWTNEQPQPTVDELNAVWSEVELIIAKKEKLTELNKQCEKTIFGRFTATVNGVEYQFSNDTEAQLNFEKADRAFDKGRITTIDWTAYQASDGSVVRLTLDQTTFEPVYMAHLGHIQGNISKLRDTLQPQLEKAKKVEEVGNISWE